MFAGSSPRRAGGRTPAAGTRRRWPRACAHGLAALLLLGAPVAGAEVYKWVDENGVAHYTVDREEIPQHLRDRLRPAPALPAPDSEPASAIATVESLEPEAASEPEATDGETLEPDASAAPAPPAEVPLEPEAPPVSARAAAEPPEPVAPREPDASLGAPPVPAPDPPALARNDAEIRDLQVQIERDREVLKELISNDPERGENVASDPRIREISERLPRLQSELEALRREGER